MKTEQERLIWKYEYIDPMFKKYECIPTKLKYMFIEKDYIKMLGSSLGTYQVNLMLEDSETFIFAFQNALCEFGKKAKKKLLNKYWEDLALYEHTGLQKMGFFWEFFPHLSGEYFKDKEFFTDFICEREAKKDYYNLILE